MKDREKQRRSAGFSLAETLLAVIILLLVSGIVAAGMPAAKTAYEKVVLASNAEVMLSSAESALREELGTAWGVQLVSTSKVTYYSAVTGTRSIMTINNEGIWVQEYVQDDLTPIPTGLISDQYTASDLTGETTKRELVHDPGVFFVTAGGFSLSGETVTVSNLAVKSGEAELAKIDSMPIKVFSVAPTTMSDGE